MAEGAGAGRAVFEINVTPLIDVLLVLLIIFLVIVPVAPRGLDALLPQPARPSSPAPEEPVVVSVLDGPQGYAVYRINQQPLPRSEIEARLAAIFAARQQRVMFVAADRSVQFDRVAEVVDMGHLAGVDDIGLLTVNTPPIR